MLNKLWNSFQPEKKEARVESLFDRAKLKMLADYFPIGRKLRYFPEYQREIVFSTIILGYRVNDHYLYSRDAVVMDGEGVPRGYAVEGGAVLAWDKLVKFQMLLPDTSDMERKLDYITRAELGRAGQFRQGNTITLVGDVVGRGVPTVDTRVERRQQLQTGPYADSSTILTTLDFATLGLADKRHKARVESGIRAGLFVTADGPGFDCVLGDFSDAALRLGIAAEGDVMPPLAQNAGVVVEFTLGLDETHAIRCKVFRREDNFCVVTLERIFRNGEFVKITAMDIMEIKTGLLNRHG